MSRKRKWRPYVMHGKPVPSAERATVLDIPDARVPEVAVRKLSPDQVRLVNREISTDTRLLAVEYCFQRWAATPVDGYGAPRLAYIVLVNRGGDAHGHTPLDDVESKILDATVRTSPPWASKFVHLWYRSDLSVTEICERLEFKHRQYVYTERDHVLCYFTGRLHELSLGIIPPPSAQA